MKNMCFRTVNMVKGRHIVKARGIGDRKTSLEGVNGVGGHEAVNQVSFEENGMKLLEVGVLRKNEFQDFQNMRQTLWA